SGGRIAGRADRQVRTAGGERIPRAAQHLVEEADPRPRLLAVELLDQAEHLVDADDRVQGDPELRLPAAGDLLDAAFEVRRRPEEPPALREELASGRRQHRPVAAAV